MKFNLMFLHQKTTMNKPYEHVKQTRHQFMKLLLACSPLTNAVRELELNLPIHTLKAAAAGVVVGESLVHPTQHVVHLSVEGVPPQVLQGRQRFAKLVFDVIEILNAILERRFFWFIKLGLLPFWLEIQTVALRT